MTKGIIVSLWLLLSALALPAQVELPAGKYPPPETIATKANLDSLARVLRSEMGTITPEPGLPDCEHGIDLVSVYNVTDSGLEYNFYSVGVKRLTEVVYGSTGREVLRHTTDPVTRDRIQIQFSLRPGNYTLVIQNADCKAISLPKPFTVPEDTPVEPNPERPATGFYNPGVYKKEVGSILYEWIPTELVDVEIRDGKVRLIAPETKKSWDGTRTCKRFLIGDIYDNKLSAADEKALFGDGLALPPGNYGFKIMYLAADSWEKVTGNLWNLIGYGLDGGEGNSKSARAETLQLSIVTGEQIQGFDANLWRASWIPQYQILPYSLKLPNNKAFGITRYLTNVAKDSLLSKITHIQYIYGWVDNVSKSRAWKNMQALTHEGFQEPDWHIRHAIMDKGYILMSEYAENYGNKYGCILRDENEQPILDSKGNTIPSTVCYDKAEEVFKGIYNRFQVEQGITSPEQIWSGSDYFTHLYGGSFAMSFDEPIAELYTGLSSVNYARSRLYNEKWYLSDYFGRGWYNYRNYLSQGYLDNLLGQLGKHAIYRRLYNHEKANLALTDRKKIIYATNAQEGLHMDKVTISGTWYRTKFDEGELLRADGIIHPFQTMLSDAFYSLLLGNAYIIWESNVPMNPDPYTFHASWFGGEDPGKTRWKPNGGTAATWDPGVNGPPKKPADGQFPEKPLVGDQGAWMGAKLYESIIDRVSQLWYPDYELNGKKIVANRGALGQSLNYAGVQNPGQVNSVKIYRDLLPILIKGRGLGGEVIIYQNPQAGLTEVQGIEVEGKFFKVVGNRLNVIRL